MHGITLIEILKINAMPAFICVII